MAHPTPLQVDDSTQDMLDELQRGAGQLTAARLDWLAAAVAAHEATVAPALRRATLVLRRHRFPPTLLLRVLRHIDELTAETAHRLGSRYSGPLEQAMTWWVLGGLYAAYDGGDVEDASLLTMVWERSNSSAGPTGIR